MIELRIDGEAVRVREGTTIWDAARHAGIDIPAWENACSPRLVCASAKTGWRCAP